MTRHTVRTLMLADLPAIKEVIDSNDLFPSDMLDDMFSEHAESGGECWLTAEQERPCAVVYCAPEPMADGVYNLLLISVHRSHQSQGVGQALVAYVEEKLRAQGHRLLLVETSGTEDFARTRSFYEQLGYEQEATIRDYYDDGDDKVVYRKRL